MENTKRLTRSLSLKYNFRNSNKTFDPKVKTFKEKSDWTPEIDLFPSNIRETINSIEKATKDILRGQKHFIKNDRDFISLSEPSNLTLEEKISIGELKNREDIIIKPAEKAAPRLSWIKTPISRRPFVSWITKNIT